MKNKAACVFDTNSLINASVSRKAFDKALDHYQILISREAAVEFTDVVGRKKFDRYVEAGEREGFEELLHREAKLIEVTETIEASRDKDDDKFLELAIAGDAEVIVSGDKDLLVSIHMRK